MHVSWTLPCQALNMQGTIIAIVNYIHGKKFPSEYLFCFPFHTWSDKKYYILFLLWMDLTNLRVRNVINWTHFFPNLLGDFGYM